MVNGQQTSGNILDIPRAPYQRLKKLLVGKIHTYNQEDNANCDKDFLLKWNKNKYSLTGWAIVMNEGGNLKTHNHEKGWLTGTFYLQMPDSTENKNEGSIVFSHKGPKYPEGTSNSQKK